MEQIITFSELNDFIFCPLSLYYHSQYKDLETNIYQTTCQTKGTSAHKAVDSQCYSNDKNIIQGMSVYTERYQLMGKIDVFHSRKRLLTERKRKIVRIYDGYVFQLYGQYFGLMEMGYDVQNLELYSMLDHRHYSIPLPENNREIFHKFEETVSQLHQFEPASFHQTNPQKCLNCIYAPLCGVEESC